MPESEPAMEGTRFPGQLNEPQQRRLIIACKYIDNLLCDIESALHSAASKSPFPRYVVDVTPEQTREIEGHIRRIREQLLESLHRLVEDSGANLVRAACDRGLQRLSEQLLVIIGEDRDALHRPIEESELRIELMKETISEAERSMRELNFLFMAEQHRISDLFVERRRSFFRSAWTESETEFAEELPSVPLGFGPRLRRRAMHIAQEISRRKVMPWLKLEQEEGERQYRAVTLRFVEIGNNFLKKLAGAGLSGLTRMPHALDPGRSFRVRSGFIFEDFIGTAHPPSPLRWLADIFLPFVGGRKLIANEAREFLQHLLQVNSSRVQNDVLNRLQESRDRLEVEIRKLLHQVSRIAEQALGRAPQSLNPPAQNPYSATQQTSACRRNRET